MIMITIRYRIGLFCRGSLTLGYYYFDNDHNVLFGPGIVRSVVLTDKIDKISEAHIVDDKLVKRPAVFIIDNVFFNYPDEIIKKKLSNNMTVESINNGSKYISVGANYYIFNTYFSEYNYYMLGNDNPNALAIFIKKAQERINKQANKRGLDEKYCFEKKCLDMFIEIQKDS